MNTALLRFVADYLADHAGRTPTGAGPRGRVLVQVGAEPGLCLRFESERCAVTLETEEGADCRVTMPWLRFVQLLDEELHPEEALELDMVEIRGEHALGERAVQWLHESGFGWHVYKHVPVWQLQANLAGRSLEAIRAFADDAYDLSLPADLGKEAAIARLVEHFRGGPRLSARYRDRDPSPIHASGIRFDPEGLRADFERLRARLEPEEKYCPGCEDAAECTLGDDCGRLEYGWTLQSFGNDHRHAVFGGPRNLLESRAVMKTEACFGIFEEIVDSLPGSCRARIKVYRPGYRFGHLPHTDACDLVRSIIPIHAGASGALSMERTLGAFERDGLYDTFDLDEPGRLYWFPSWLMHSGRNQSRERERVFLLISQRFDEDTRRLQGSAVEAT